LQRWARIQVGCVVVVHVARHASHVARHTSHVTHPPPHHCRRHPNGPRALERAARRPHCSQALHLQIKTNRMPANQTQQQIGYRRTATATAAAAAAEAAAAPNTHFEDHSGHRPKLHAVTKITKMEIVGVPQSQPGGVPRRCSHISHASGRRLLPSAQLGIATSLLALWAVQRLREPLTSQPSATQENAPRALRGTVR